MPNRKIPTNIGWWKVQSSSSTSTTDEHWTSEWMNLFGRRKKMCDGLSERTRSLFSLKQNKKGIAYSWNTETFILVLMYIYTRALSFLMKRRYNKIMYSVQFFFFVVRYLSFFLLQVTPFIIITATRVYGTSRNFGLAFSLTDRPTYQRIIHIHYISITISIQLFSITIQLVFRKYPTQHTFVCIFNWKTFYLAEGLLTILLGWMERSNNIFCFLQNRMTREEAPGKIKTQESW